MKIAMVIPTLVDEGGGERQFLYLARQLQKKGHLVTIYTFKYDIQNCYPEIAKGLDIKSVHRHRYHAVPKKIIPSLGIYRFYLRLYPDLRRLRGLMDGNYDILNCHAEGVHWLAPLVRKRVRKIIWMCNDIPTAIEFGQRCSRAVQGIKRVKLYLDKYGLSRLLAFLDRIAIGHIDRIVVLSDKVKDMIFEAYGRRAVVVRSGVDINCFNNINTEKARGIRERYGIGTRDFLVFSLSLLQPLRRLEDLIAAVQILIKRGLEIRVVLGGDLNYNVNYSTYLSGLVKDKGLTPRVLFIGKVSESELPAYYQAADVFVFPSDERQTWGLVVFEAMASQRPVIVSSACGASEVLEDGKTAYLFPPRCPQVLAEKIERLMKDPQKSLELAQKGYQYVKGNFSWERYVIEMEKLFTDSLKFIPA